MLLRITISVLYFLINIEFHETANIKHKRDIGEKENDSKALYIAYIMYNNTYGYYKNVSAEYFRRDKLNNLYNENISNTVNNRYITQNRPFDSMGAYKEAKSENMVYNTALLYNGSYAVKSRQSSMYNPFSKKSNDVNESMYSRNASDYTAVNNLYQPVNVIGGKSEKMVYNTGLNVYNGSYSTQRSLYNPFTNRSSEYVNEYNHYTNYTMLNKLYNKSTTEKIISANVFSASNCAKNCKRVFLHCVCNNDYYDYGNKEESK